MKPEFQAAIEEQYDLKVAACNPGPRQFVAETHILEDDQGRQWFCKLVDKPLFIREIVPALPLVADMHEQGIDRICYPIKSKSGLHFFVGDTLIVLYNFIPEAIQGYDYDVRAFGELIAQIHATAPSRNTVVPVEAFSFPYEELFEERFEKPLASSGADSVLKAFRNVLRKHEKTTRSYKEEFHRLAVSCKSKEPALVITHGDAPGNVLMKSHKDIYIIDWDEAMLTPAERDIWMIDQVPGFMDGYRKIRPDFHVDTDLRSFYTLKYLFQRNMHYFSEILKEEAPDECRLDYVEQLDEALSDKGWMAPRLAEVRANMS